MNFMTIARPYAKAAFEQALEDHTLPQWMHILSLAAEVVALPEVQAILPSPAIPAQDLAAFFIEACQVPPASPMANLFFLLAEYRRFQALPEISSLFSDLKIRHEGVLPITAHAARALSPEQIQALVAALERRFEKQIHLEVIVDPKLLAGVTIDILGKVIDGSAKTRLNQLLQALEG